MTNREWLSTLTDEELTEFWRSEEGMMKVKGKAEPTATCIGRGWTSSIYGICHWLGSERKEE